MKNAEARSTGDGPVIDIATVLDAQPVTRFNVLVILIGWFAIFADGFDLTGIGYVMPNLMKEFHLGAQTVGFVTSASLVSGPIGALALGWVSDRHGRKLALIIGCLVVSLLTFANIFATSTESLVIVRFLVGCGLGGVIPNIIALSSEFAPKRLRARLIIFTFCGINFGGFMSGLVAPVAIANWGWRGLFGIGAVVPLIAVVLLQLWMPESVKFLALHGGREAELRSVLRRLVPSLAMPAGARFVVASQATRVPFRVGQLFAGGLKWITPIVWTMYALNLFTLYFAGAWTNIVLQQSGVPQTQSILVSSLNQGGGVLGALVIAYFVDRFGFLAVIAWGCLTAATVWMIGIPGLPLGWIAVWVVVSGFGMQGVQYGVNAVPGMIYPTSFRAFGTGWAGGFGRIGAVLGPIVGGYFVAMFEAEHLAKAEIAQRMFIVPVFPLITGIILAAIAARLSYRHFHGYQFEEATVRA
ncbi:MAG TPA: MFS transporter [Stellaceae bacterium]|nr:MFS transporter [Stellaceae bacterium]